MANLQYFCYPGAGEFARDHLCYSQAVRVGDRIECSGQGGWTFTNGTITFPSSIEDEIAQAFENVQTNLKHAGGEGWTQVFRVNSYHRQLTPEVTALMTANMAKWMPGHKPIWTEVGVKELGAEDMNVEIEVVAYVG